MKLRLPSHCVKSIPPSSLITRHILILVTPRISQASGERHPALHLPPLLACWITFWLPRYPEAQARAGTCLPPRGLRLVLLRPPSSLGRLRSTLALAER